MIKNVKLLKGVMEEVGVVSNRRLAVEVTWGLCSTQRSLWRTF